ncbi:GNAT family N-acetyltransferase [Herbaspirillum sp. SJZ099]|uniref:GNAT family N-acetyltransferase n=1 Tax=Herbaspirillum sp. SJZ099 TaxID=2572916 RepID=UPI0011A7CF0D|nr:GNAT family N-acetyltransferase [Herbaspirillum sp. SJZ099]TWC65787.1 CelD/BcsL family acetyltransferase involved in cellulose biosynthesis [Herbaspirillum sp. SJZ099]
MRIEPAAMPVVVPGLAPGALQVRVFTSLEAAQARWEAAGQACAGYGFQRFAWLVHWQRQLGQRQGWRPALTEVCDAGGRTLMFIPFGLRSQAGLRVLGLLGGEVTDYNACLLHPDFARQVPADRWEAFWQALQPALPPFDLVRIRRSPLQIEHPASGEMFDNPLTYWPQARAAWQLERAHIATLGESFGAFQKTRSARMFADTRRQRRRLEELCPGGVRIVLRAQGTEQDAIVAAMARQKARRWRETGSRDLFAEPGYLDFYRGLAADCGGAQGWVQVSALFVGDEIVATHWGIGHGRRFYWIMPGYEDGQWGRYSVGRVLMEAVLQDCIARGFALFDLTVGDEAYKAQWADHELALASFEAGVSWRGKGVVALRRLWRAAREKARGHRGLRNLVRRLSGKAPL